MTWAGEAARPFVSAKHFPPTAGGTGGIHCERMKHDRHVSIIRLQQGGIHTFRDGCGDEGRSAARTSTAHWSRRSMRRSVETLLAEKSDGWANGAVAEPVAWVSWGKPVLRLAGLSAGRKSGAGAGEI
jgi:hypothetical protein